MTTSIPVCLYPMRKIILDDDHFFAESILLKLHGKNFISYNSPNQLLTYLLHEYQPSYTKFDLVTKNLQIADSFTQHIINIDIERLEKIILNYSHQDISVLFVDYHMPELKGNEFLEKIRHLPFKKVLITGEEDYKIAVDAFNSGLVDAYLRKDDPHFSSKMQNITSELEWKYFIDLSSLITTIPEFNYLKNIYFITAFKQFLQENNITAFCLTHIQGNFTTQSITKKRKYLILRSKNHLKELSKIAEEDGGTLKTIENLKLGKVIPFFGKMEYWEVPAADWGKFLYPAVSLLGDANLVWTTIDL